MRCFTVDGSGFSGLRADQRPAPGPPSPGEVLVDVHAVALNYRDLLVASGDYGGRQEPPIIAASDMAGVVSQVGPGVNDLAEGDRVVNAPLKRWPAGALNRPWSKTFVGGQGVDGVLAEQVVYPAEALCKLPQHLTLEEGSTLTVAGLTAWAAVVTHGRTRPGQWVLVHGTGGVSLFAAQFAKLCGARVILTTSSPDKARIAREKFAVDESLDYRNEDWPRRVREITAGKGVDVVVEVAGGRSLASSIEACNYGARVAVVGVLDGLLSEINVFSLIMRQVTLRGIYMESAAEMRAMVDAVAASGLRPQIDRIFSFDAAPEAYAHLQSRHHMGKVVIQVRS